MSGPDSVLKFDLTIKATGSAGGNAADTVLLNKGGAYGVIQRMRIFHGGALLSDIDNYANLLDMLVPIQQSSDALVSKLRILAGTDYRGGAPFFVGQNPTAVNTEVTHSYCLPLLSIFSLTQNYVPLFALSGSPIRVELQLVSSINQICKSLVQVGLPIGKSIISRCELVCNMIELSDSAMMIIKNSIGSGPLQWVTQDYKNYGSNITLAAASETSVSIPVPAKFNSLNSLFFTFRRYPNGTALFQANESCTFNLQEYFLRIGSKTLPVKPPNTSAEFFGELLRAFGTVADINQECSVSIDQYTRPIPTAITGAEAAQNTGAFYVGIDLESYSNTSMDTVYTGSNTSTDDIFFNPRFGTPGANAINIRIDAYALYDQLILIQNGACTVNY
jgi:hypothetical protein